MSQELTKKTINSIMHKVGLDMASQLKIDKNLPVEERLNLARVFADSMGAATELSDKKDAFIIESHNCPLASAVRADPCVCKVIASFFSNTTGCQVKEMCDRSSDKLLCRYSILKR